MSKEHKPKERYGAWAGDPKGRPEDKTRCIEEVWGGPRGMISYQCGKKRGHGPKGYYCAQHSPDAKAKRAAAATARFEADMERRYKPQRDARAFEAALKKIRDGHNDPRTLAKEVLKERGYD